MAGSIREAPLDLEKLKQAGIEAQKKIDQWPKWYRDLVKEVHNRMSTEKLI